MIALCLASAGHQYLLLTFTEMYINGSSNDEASRGSKSGDDEPSVKYNKEKTLFSLIHVHPESEKRRE